MSNTKQRTVRTAEQRARMSEGQRLAGAVRAYLNLLDEQRDRRRHPVRNPDTIRSELAALEDAIKEEKDPTARLALIQRRIDLTATLNSADQLNDTSQIEEAFVAAALDYSNRKGITWPAWRAVGVPAAVLAQAGIPRTRQRRG